MRPVALTAVIALVLSLFGSVATAQQCPPSVVTVELVTDDSPGCATIAPAADAPELDITNDCGDDQFHIEGGVDCPNCGPPLTLRPGTFGSFIVEGRGVAAFTPQSMPTQHTLTWARGNSTGSLQVRVVPSIVECPDPDMGHDMSDGPATVMEPGPAEDSSGCCATTAPPRTPLALWLLLALGLLRRRASSLRQREEQHE